MNAINVALHQGKVMYRLAKNYADLSAVIKEVVQNSVDSCAKRIAIQISVPQRTFTVYDNGSGASREKITQALQSIGNTLKDVGKYGQFGLGLISPISIAREFTLTSCPAPRRSDFMEYRFVTATIIKQKQVSIPSSPVSGLEHDPNGKTWWRTKVNVGGITKDRRTSHLDPAELTSDIALKFGDAIRERQIDITIDITNDDGHQSILKVEAPQFSGRKIDVFKEEMPESGKVKVELYIAPLGRRGRQGKVVFGTMNNPSRLSPKQFVDCTVTLLDQPVAKALLSGVFEGQVLCEKVALHADRTKFEENDALFVLCEVLGFWHKKVGKKIIIEVEEQASDDRFQRIGVQVMPYAELLLKQVEFESVARLITVGSVGPEHVKVSRKQIIGQDDGTSVSIGGKPFEEKEICKGGSGSGGKTIPKIDHPLHKPGLVYGPRGRKRTDVRSSSTGLRFEHVEMEDFRVPFVFEPRTGMLSFNINNPNWGLCQENDTFLSDYHMAVINTALSAELFRDTGGMIHPEVTKFAHENLSHQVFAIRNGKAIQVKH
ncbi:MAG: ATP-binding protein [Candidatus Paceibacterota bacterium]|jgi:hypothetical protein